MSPPTSEDAEWLAELIERWTEVYKKSATTLVLLRIIAANGPMSTGDIGAALTESTGWRSTERGLYRTLQRLAKDGLLTVSEVAAPRTGAKRKDYALSDLGRRYLDAIEDEVV